MSYLKTIVYAVLLLAAPIGLQAEPSPKFDLRQFIADLPAFTSEGLLSALDFIENEQPPEDITRADLKKFVEFLQALARAGISGDELAEMEKDFAALLEVLDEYDYDEDEE